LALYLSRTTVAEKEPRNLPAELDAEGLQRDIESIEQVEEVLAAPDPYGLADQLPMEQAVKLFGRTRVFRTLDTTKSNLKCRVDLEFFLGMYRVHSATCTPMDRQKWLLALPYYRSHLRQLVARDDQLEAGNVAGRADPTGDRARARVLGPIPKLSVPAQLREAYALLGSREDETGYGSGPGCGPVQFAADKLLAAGRADLLRAALRGPSPAGRVWAAVGLIRNSPLESDDRRVFELLPQLTPEVWGCGDCAPQPVDVGKEIREQLAMRSAAADLGLLPAIARRPVRPGRDSDEPAKHHAVRGVVEISSPDIQSRLVNATQMSDRMRAGMAACYGRALAEGPKQEGIIDLTMNVHPDGGNPSVKAVAHGTLSSELSTCIKARVQVLPLQLHTGRTLQLRAVLRVRSF